MREERSHKAARKADRKKKRKEKRKARSKYREKLVAMIEEDTRHKRLKQEEFEQFVALVSHEQPRSNNTTGMKETTAVDGERKKNVKQQRITKCSSSTTVI